MPDELPPTVHAAQDYIARGWPVLPVGVGKQPLTAHGVKDATTDERTVLHWFERWPDAGVGIATGAPGPTVLDVDQPDKVTPEVTAALAALAVPTVATARGTHLYFAGLDLGTIVLGFGELRGRGSYVVAPPSVHPSGKVYVWTAPVNGALPKVPAILHENRQTSGAGPLEAPELVPYNKRHPFLEDFAVRLVRSGVLDEPTLAQALEAMFWSRCDPRPPPRPREFSDLARWAARTDIADREREKTKKLKKADGVDLGTPPGRDAALTDHKAFLARAGGWDPMEIAEVVRYGTGPKDPLTITLTNGLIIKFNHQSEITVPGGWAKAAVLGTNGHADPPGLKQWQLLKVLRSLCLIASVPADGDEVDQHADIFNQFLDLCEREEVADFSDSPTRLKLIVRLRERNRWDPGADYDPRKKPPAPVMVVDHATGERYFRAGELRDYFQHRKAAISTDRFRACMEQLGLTHVWKFGREAAGGKKVSERQTASMLFYRWGDLG